MRNMRTRPGKRTSRTRRTSRTSRQPSRTTRTRGPRTSRVTPTVLERHKRRIPERLAAVRAGRSQRLFAHELGVFQQNVNRYEHGTTPHADFLITLALQENISLDWLLLGRGSSMRARGQASSRAR